VQAIGQGRDKATQKAHYLVSRLVIAPLDFQHIKADSGLSNGITSEDGLLSGGKGL